MSDILQTILARKREEIADLRQRESRSSLSDRALAQSPPRGFARAMARAEIAVIAEVKRASPSKGLIRADFDPGWIAADYQRGGAACLSVLTDREFFRGANDDLVAARAACRLPVIRKDFLIDEWQVLEARAIGADCVLLIAAALSATQLMELYHCAVSLGMDVLVEVHDAAELQQVLAAGLPQQALLGVNNRSLRSFVTRLETTLELLPQIPKGYAVVTESGIGSPVDVRRMLDVGVTRFLVGESLMREPSPGAALQRLLLA